MRELGRVTDPVFTAEQTHGRVLRAGNRLILHSQDAGWHSLHAAIFEEAPFRARESAIGHPSLIYHLSRPTDVARRVEGERRERSLIGPRRFCLTPGDSATLWEHSGHPEILQVYLKKTVLERAIEDMYGGDGRRAQLVPRFAIVDPLLEQLALAIIAALHDSDAHDRLYIETVAQMMAVHLARTHSTRSGPERAAARDGLSRERLRRLIDYIEANLDGDLSIEAMAAELELSAPYVARVFKTAVGQPPHKYVLSRRIERAKELLRDTAAPVADVALLSGFSSQSHLSHWFRRVVGVSPAAYRRHH